jgi:K+-sensing histidine kinase KdpD
LAGEVLRFARRENITQIVIGRSRAGFFARLLRKSLTEEIAQRSTDIAVHVVMDDQAKPAAERRPGNRSTALENWADMAGAALSVAAAVGLGHLLDLWRQEEAARLNRFVSNLLDMSRIEAGALAPRRDFIDVGDVVGSAVERCRKAFPGLKTSVSFARDLPLIRGDANLLSQVVFNLLDNAHKYGGGAASVYARRDDADIVVTVTDEGPGVKPTDLERIFEKFYRGGRSDGRKAGTGLGLSICRGLVEAMGGTIIAQSPAVRRRGTRIIMRFPVPEQPRRGMAA